MSTSNMSRPGPISQQSRMSLSSHWPSAPAQAKIRTYDLSRTKSYMFVELSWSRLQQQEVMWGHWIAKGKQSQIELKALRCPLQKVNHVNTYKYRFSSQSKDIKIFPADKNSAMQVKSVHICGKDQICPTTAVPLTVVIIGMPPSSEDPAARVRTGRSAAARPMKPPPLWWPVVALE